MTVDRHEGEVAPWEANYGESRSLHQFLLRRLGGLSGIWLEDSREGRYPKKKICYFFDGVVMVISMKTEKYDVA